MSAPRKFVLTLREVADWPGTREFEDKMGNPGDPYAFVEAGDMEELARAVCVHLKAEVVTDDAVYYPSLTSLKRRVRSASDNS